MRVGGRSFEAAFRGVMDVRVLVLALASTATLFSAAGAQSVRPSSFRADPFSALVGKRAPAEERKVDDAAVERYVVATDDRVFLFQADDDLGRLKYLCGDRERRIDCEIDEANPAEEIHLLTPTRVSRGDIVWRDAEGQMLLRVAAYGGVTVFFPGDPRGQAASKSFGEDPPLTLPPVGFEAARMRAQRATAIVSAAVGAPILFEIGSAGADADAAVLADAVARAAKGLGKVARDPTGARVIAARIKRVEFREADAARLSIEKGVLVVGYNPAGDVSGRPSSGRIARFLEDSL